jgi:hypothetical protein
MSVAQFCKQGLTCIFTPKGVNHNLQCQIIDKDHHTLMYRQFDDEGLYRLITHVKEGQDLKKELRALATKRKRKIRKEKRSRISTEKL